MLRHRELYGERSDRILNAIMQVLICVCVCVCHMSAYVSMRHLMASSAIACSTASARFVCVCVFVCLYIHAGDCVCALCVYMCVFVGSARIDPQHDA